MNSKGEYNRCRLPRKIIEGAENRTESNSIKVGGHEKLGSKRQGRQHCKESRGDVWEWGMEREKEDNIQDINNQLEKENREDGHCEKEGSQHGGQSGGVRGTGVDDWDKAR